LEGETTPPACAIAVAGVVPPTGLVDLDWTDRDSPGFSSGKRVQSHWRRKGEWAQSPAGYDW